MIFKIILIHALALFSGILVSGLPLIILMPTAIVVQKHKLLKLPFSLFMGLLGGLACFYIGALIFNWFNIELTFWLGLFYMIFIVLNANKRLNRPDTDKIIEWGWLFGEIFGLFLGAFIFG
jgi:hypothetical protein